MKEPGQAPDAATSTAFKSGQACPIDRETVDGTSGRLTVCNKAVRQELHSKARDCCAVAFWVFVRVASDGGPSLVSGHGGR